MLFFFFNPSLIGANGMLGWSCRLFFDDRAGFTPASISTHYAVFFPFFLTRFTPGRRRRFASYRFRRASTLPALLVALRALGRNPVADQNSYRLRWGGGIEQ